MTCNYKQNQSTLNAVIHVMRRDRACFDFRKDIVTGRPIEAL